MKKREIARDESRTLLKLLCLRWSNQRRAANSLFRQPIGRRVLSIEQGLLRNWSQFGFSSHDRVIGRLRQGKRIQLKLDGIVGGRESSLRGVYCNVRISFIVLSGFLLTIECSMGLSGMLIADDSTVI